MLFNSFIFFIFLGVILPIYYSIPKKNGRNLFLLLASYFFYGYWDWRFCGLLLLSTLIDFYIGLQIEKAPSQKKKKLFMLTSVFVNLGILGFFKYFNFFVESFEKLGSSLGVHFDYLHLNILLPVGISFYTFQTLSYSIDIYRGKLTPTKNIIDFALFVSFFPQLVAGPIERAVDLLPQISKKQIPSRIQIEKGIHLIVTGLFRKVMIGDTAGRYVDHIFSNIQDYKSSELIAAAFIFSIQIYADFSGYSNIARGTAKLLGFELMKNFEQPYLSRNITEFWRRWHISLSSWLKDYLYISLGGNRKGGFKTKVNLFITMLLGGLWHGASLNFIIWGALHGLFLSIHKKMIGSQKTINNSVTISSFVDLKIIVNIIFTYLIAVFTFLIFRLTKWEDQVLFFNKMINWEASDFTWKFTSITIAFISLSFLFDLLEYKTKRHTFLLSLKNKSMQYGILSALFLITLLFMFQSDPLPFVYFQF